MSDLELPWWKFHARDWLADPDLRMLSWAEKGVLIDLMALFWMKGTLPTEPSRLARLVGIDEDQFDKTWPSLKGFFEQTEDDLLVHRELDAKREEAMERHQKWRESGQKGAKMRWGDKEAAQDGDADRDPNRDPIASSDSRPQTADAAHLGGSGDRGATDGAKVTKDKRPCPSCGEKWIDADSERCSQCATASSDDRGGEDEIPHLPDLPF